MYSASMYTEHHVILYRLWSSLKLSEFSCLPRIIDAALVVKREQQQQLSDLDGGSSSNVTLTCQAEGSPAPVIRWAWQGNEIR